MRALPRGDPIIGFPGGIHRASSLERERGVATIRWTHVPTAISVAVVIVAWLVLILTVSQFRFVIVAPSVKSGFEVFLALLRLFAALVLFLFPVEVHRARLRWVALGFLILGLGGVGFGYLYPAVGTTDLNAAMYGSLVTRSLAAGTIAVALVLARTPEFSPRAALLPLTAFGLLSLTVVVASHRLPTLVAVDDLEALANTSTHTLAGLTQWHWSLSLLPIAFSAAAAIGAARHFPGRVLGGWLVVAMVLMAGSQLHTLFWPSAYSPVVTTSSLLRLAFTTVVAVGGFLELRHVAAERAASLAIEREYTMRLRELAALRAGFTAMVVHEIGNPLATIRQAADLLATGPLDPLQTRALAAVIAETAALTALVDDVRTAAEAERDEFPVHLRPIPAVDLLAANAVALSGDHPLDIEDIPEITVLADPGRIGQVLRNLLSNAAKYSSPGTPIRLRAIQNGDRVRVEVIDRGSGIHPDDLNRIFEKFGRGCDLAGRKRPGIGLGLYLSRRIVRAHGSDLSVDSTPGAGSTFAFELEVAP